MKPWRAVQVFTTCGSAAKRAYLQQTFPWLDDAHIGDSRSTSFEATVLGQVGGGRRPYLDFAKSSQNAMRPLGSWLALALQGLFWVRALPCHGQHR